MIRELQCRRNPFVPLHSLTLSKMDPQEPNQSGSTTPPKPAPSTTNEQPPKTESSDANMTDAQPKEPQEEPLPQEILELTAEDILARARLIENEIKVSSNYFQPCHRIPSLCLSSRGTTPMPRAVLTQVSITGHEK